MKITEALLAAQRHLNALEEFMDSEAHAGYVRARQHELGMINERIAAFDPGDPSQLMELFKLFGERRVLSTLPTLFEDARMNLKSKIDELEVELDNPLHTQQE